MEHFENILGTMENVRNKNELKMQMEEIPQRKMKMKNLRKWKWETKLNERN